VFFIWLKVLYYYYYYLILRDTPITFLCHSTASCVLHMHVWHHSHITDHVTDSYGREQFLSSTGYVFELASGFIPAATSLWLWHRNFLLMSYSIHKNGMHEIYEDMLSNNVIWKIWRCMNYAMKYSISFPHLFFFEVYCPNMYLRCRCLLKSLCSCM
jgi:hypothetical protein